jgi:hypothetical protein
LSVDIPPGFSILVSESDNSVSHFFLRNYLQPQSPGHFPYISGNRFISRPLLDLSHSDIFHFTWSNRSASSPSHSTQTEKNVQYCQCLVPAGLQWTRLYIRSTLVSRVKKLVMIDFRTDRTVSLSIVSQSHSTVSKTCSAVRPSSAGPPLRCDTSIRSGAIDVTVEGAECDTHIKDGQEVIDPDATADDLLGDNKPQFVQVWFERVPRTVVVRYSLCVPVEYIYVCRSPKWQ